MVKQNIFSHKYVGVLFIQWMQLFERVEQKGDGMNGGAGQCDTS